MRSKPERVEKIVGAIAIYIYLHKSIKSARYTVLSSVSLLHRNFYLS